MDNVVIPFLAFCLVFNSVYFSIKNGKLKPQQRNELIIGLLIMGFSIWYELDKSDKIQALQTSNDTLNKNVELSATAIKNKIDSAKKGTVDSMVSINERTVTTLQKTIREQSHAIDSLIRIHGEKELTDDEKKDIITKILKLTQGASPQNVPVFLNISQGANSGKFPSQLYDYLKSRKYNVITATITDPSIKKYNVHISSSDGKPEIDIDIGSF